jgi:hypothetical protein
MEVQGTVGLTSQTSGTRVSLRQDTDGSLFVKRVSPGLAEAALAGRLFHAATQTDVVTVIDLTKTWTGYAVGNPATSGKNYIIHEFGYAVSAVYADETDLCLGVGSIAGLDADDTPQPCLVGGGSTSQAYVSTGAELTTALVKAMFITSLDDIAVELGYNAPPQVVDVGGRIVLAPGYMVGTVTTVAIATGTVANFHFVWEEVDV